MARLVRSTSFRLVLVYLAVFGVSVLLLLAFIYWSTAGYMARQADAAIEAEIELLEERYRTLGLRGLTALIEERMPDYPDRSNLYLLADRGSRPISGNLERWPRNAPGPEGWIEFKVQRPDGPEEWNRARARTFLLRGGLRLLVGRDMHEFMRVRSLMLESFAWATALTLLLAVAGGYTLSRSVTRRLDVINETSRDIMTGDLGRRIPLQGSDDEFDELISHLNAMLDRIETLMQDVGRVSDNIAHDLKTPLTRLRNELEALHGEVGDQEQVERALQEADSLLATFNALLRIARIEAGNRRAGFDKLDLAAVARDVAEFYQPLAEDKEITFSLRDRESVLVNGDRDLLFQALANLVDNAIKYTPSGGLIAMAVSQTNGVARVAVGDNGPGVPESARAKIFDRFYRFEASRNTPGSGLGLALVDAVVRLHEAQVSLEDNEPGLQVRIDLPVVSAE